MTPYPKTPFSGLLPHGYHAIPFETEDTYIVSNRNGQCSAHYIDKLIPLKAHVTYIWHRYFEELIEEYDGRVYLGATE